MSAGTVLAEVVVDNWPTRALISSHALAASAKWAVVPGVLVQAFTWGGPRAVGVMSLALLVPLFAGAPLVAASQSRWTTHRIRTAAFAVQLATYGAAGAAAAVDAPTPVVAPLVVAGLCAFMLTPPTTAALLPQVARSATAMVRANLWVTYGDSTSGLIGSLAAALMLGLGGPAPVFFLAAAATGCGLFMTVWRVGPNVRSARATTVAGPNRNLSRTVSEFRAHAWGRAVVVLLASRNLLLGSFDVLLVIVAIDGLDLGDAGTGYLSALVGVGALGSTLITTQVVRRAWLRGALMAAVSFGALAALVLGVRIDRPVVFVALPLIGVAMAMIDALCRMLMIRSVDPREIAPLYASLTFVGGGSQVLGSVIAQVALAVGDAALAFLVIGAVLGLFSSAAIRSLRRADEHAEIPVVEMALLAGQPMLSALPSAELEQVARSAETVTLSAGEELTIEGDAVDACYVVAEGALEVAVGGRVTGVVTRGDVVGEVALLAGLTATSSTVAQGEVTALRIERRMFLLALTGQDVLVASGAADLADARRRFRAVVEAHQRDAASSGSPRPDRWVGLGAAGRVLGEPTFPDALVRGARMAEESGNDAALAEAAALAIWPGAFFFVADNPDDDMIELCERALAKLRPDDPLRVRVLAALASNLAFVAPLSERRTLMDEARSLAVTEGDPALLGVALNAEFTSMWEPATFDRRAAIGPELTEAARQAGDPEMEYLGRFLDAFCMTERGLVHEARAQLVELRELAPLANNEYFVFLGERLLLSIDIAQGRDDVRPRIDELAARHADGVADTDGTWALQIGSLAYEDGSFAGMARALEDMLDGPHARTWRAALALAYAHGDDHRSAARVLFQQGDVPRSYFWLTVMQTRAEVAAMLGMVDQCEAFYADLLPFRHHLGITASGSRIHGTVARTLGELCIALGRHVEAVDALDEAVARATSAGLAFEAVASRRLLAQAHIAAGDPASARLIAQEALSEANARGYAREVVLLEDVARSGSS